VQVDHRGQIQEPAIGDGQISDVADIPLVRRVGGEVPLEQVGDLLVRRLRHRGADPLTQMHTHDAMGTHHSLHPLVVDTQTLIAQLGGDPRGPVGAIEAGLGRPTAPAGPTGAASHG
jgi:hypothetical protein